MTDQTRRINRVRNDALRFIASQQQGNGSFLSDQGKPTTFYTSLICTAVSDSAMRDKAARFLLSQLSNASSCNYWQRGSDEEASVPYPDDLDDTALALLAIHSFQPELVTETHLARLAQLLIANEEKPGGPYQTWILDARSPEWHDIDVVVNSTIAFLLASLGIQQQTLDKYIEKQCLSESHASKYYDDPIVVLYFISRAYAGHDKNVLVRQIVGRRNSNGHWDTPLRTALAVSSLLRLGVSATEVSEGVQFLLDSSVDGQWPQSPFIIESYAEGFPVHSSCSAHLSACCVEALALYEKTIQYSGHSNTEQTDPHLITAVRQHCSALFSDSSPAIQQQLDNAMNALDMSDVVLLPYRFSSQLLPEENAISLSALGVLGWIGYGICDDIVDGEDAVGLLPLAILCVRKVETIITSFQVDTRLFSNILSGIAGATAWEYEQCRIENANNVLVLPEALPDYGDYAVLAQKSLGHAIPILFACMLAHRGGDAAILQEFFIHYLIARQLNDDAHDWLLDLQNGFLNSVSAHMLRAWKKGRQIDLAKDEQELQELFWQHEIDHCSALIAAHCAFAKSALKKTTVISDVAFLWDLIAPLEHAVKIALAERDRMSVFLAAIEMRY
ncbi:MAG: hypothetical protein V4478_00955 [Patescibacteria group bacterium]